MRSDRLRPTYPPSLPASLPPSSAFDLWYSQLLPERTLCPQALSGLDWLPTIRAACGPRCSESGAAAPSAAAYVARLGDGQSALSLWRGEGVAARRRPPLLWAPLGSDYRLGDECGPFVAVGGAWKAVGSKLWRKG